MHYSYGLTKEHDGQTGPLSLKTYVEYVTSLLHSDFACVSAEKVRRKYVTQRGNRMQFTLCPLGRRMRVVDIFYYLLHPQLVHSVIP